MSAFDAQLKVGKRGESRVMLWLVKKGWHVQQILQPQPGSGVGPRVQTPGGDVVSTDMFAYKGKTCMSVEVKTKSVFAWWRKGKVWVTGVDRNSYTEYLRYETTAPFDVWLMFLHTLSTPSVKDRYLGCPPVCPTGLFGGALHLIKHGINHTCEADKWGKGGMVYWGEQSLEKLADLSDVPLANGEPDTQSEALSAARPLGNTMRAPGNTFASVATYKLTEEGHAKADVRAAVVAMKGDGPDPLLTPDEVDELRAVMGAEPPAPRKRPGA